MDYLELMLEKPDVVKLPYLTIKPEDFDHHHWQNVTVIFSFEKHVILTLANSQKVLMRKSLSKILKVIPESEFIQCHRSYLVRIGAIKKIETSRTGSILMKDGSVVPLAARRKVQVLRCFDNHLLCSACKRPKDISAN